MLYAFALLVLAMAASSLAKNLPSTAEVAAVAKTRHLSTDGADPVVAQVTCVKVLQAITWIKTGDAESLAGCLLCEGNDLKSRMSAHAASYHLLATSFGIEQIHMDDQRDVSYDVTCEFSKADCESAPDSVCDATFHEDRRALSVDDAFDGAFDGAFEGEPPLERARFRQLKACSKTTGR